MLLIVVANAYRVLSPRMIDNPALGKKRADQFQMIDEMEIWSR
jgi:hypothetical protein